MEPTKNKDVELRENVKQKLHIFYLPSEIIFKTFSYLKFGTLLTKIQLVCTIWKNIVEDSILWKHFKTLSWTGYNFTNISEVITKCSNLRSLEIETFNGHSGISPLFDAISKLLKLEKLSLINFYFDDDEYQNSSNFLKNLNHLNSLIFQDTSMTPNILKTLSEFTGLTHLNFSYIDEEEFEDSFIKLFRNNLLEHFEIDQHYVDSLGENCIPHLIEHCCGTLKTLIIGKIETEDERFVDIEKCELLTTLTLFCECLTPETIHRISKIKNLQHLELNAIYDGDCRDVLLELIKEGRFPKLKTLTLDDDDDFSDSVQEVITANCSEVVLKMKY